MKQIIKYVKYFTLFCLILIGAFHISVNYMVNRDLPPQETQVHSSGAEYYFAYGANMAPKYLKNVRNVAVLDSKKARLDGYKLVFNLKGPNFLEPGFANISASDKSFVDGVAHLLTKKDLRRIVESEPDQYLIADIKVNIDGQPVKAKTLIYLKGGDTEFRPSRRYLNLLIGAGEQFSFSEDYMSQLRNRDSAYFPIASELFGSVVYAFVMLAAR